MRTRTRIIVGIVAALVAWLGALAWVGTTGEVVFLVSTRDSGAPQRTPLWIVDHQGSAWLRTRSDQTRWFLRLQSEPRVELERAGTTAIYRATPVPEATPEINALVAEKYGFADRLVPLIAPWTHGDPMAVRLDPWPT
jgi:hypothetical protein